MAQFDLGTDLLVERQVPCGPDRAWRLAREVLVGYEEMGFRVAFEEESPPERMVAQVTDGKGTRLSSRVVVEPRPRGAAVRAHLTGTIHVGGMQGMLASAGMVRKVARERLEGLLDRVFADVGPDPEGDAALDGGTAAAPAPAPAPAPGPAPAPAPAPGGARSIEERLRLVKELHDRGLISAEEMRQKKQELLGEL